MEDYQLDLIIGEGPAARSVKIDLAKFTLVGATTRTGLLTTPLRDRFGIPVRLNFYTHAELTTIVTRGAGVLKVAMSPDGAAEIARRSRGTPRIAGRLLRRVRDFAAVQGAKVITAEMADGALSQLEVDSEGLDALDHRYLNCIAKNYDGGPVGIETISAALSGAARRAGGDRRALPAAAGLHRPHAARACANTAGLQAPGADRGPARAPPPRRSACSTKPPMMKAAARRARVRHVVANWSGAVENRTHRLNFSTLGRQRGARRARSGLGMTLSSSRVLADRHRRVRQRAAARQSWGHGNLETTHFPPPVLEDRRRNGRGPVRPDQLRLCRGADVAPGGDALSHLAAQLAARPQSQDRRDRRRACRRADHAGRAHRGDCQAHQRAEARHRRAARRLRGQPQVQDACRTRRALVGGAGRAQSAARRACRARQSRLVGRPRGATRRQGPRARPPRSGARRHPRLRERRHPHQQGRPRLLARPASATRSPSSRAASARGACSRASTTCPARWPRSPTTRPSSCWRTSQTSSRKCRTASRSRCRATPTAARCVCSATRRWCPRATATATPTATSWKTTAT